MPVLIGDQAWTLVIGKVFTSGTATQHTARLTRLLRRFRPDADPAHVQETCLRTPVLTPDRLATITNLLAPLSQSIAEDLRTSPGGATHQGALRLRNTLEFIQAHCSEPLTAEQLARKAGLSPRQFSRLFKEETGMTFTHYLRYVRIEKSKELLADHKLNIKAVAAESGFHSRDDFDRVFRRYTRTSPRAYRAALKEAKRALQS